jgi:glutaryl-CoA dehydrogenase
MPDYLDVARHLSSDEQHVRRTVRAFVDERVLPSIAAHWEAGTFPLEWARALGALGVLGGNLTGYGCAGASEVAYGVAMQELERGDSGVRSFASVQGSLVMGPIHAFGSDDQKRRYLPRLATGEAIGCFGLTEPDFGSNPAGMRSVAIDDGDAYVLRGTKRWITNGGIAEIAVVWAKLGGPDGEVRGFLVPTATRGFEARPIERKMSLRASVTSELWLDDVRVTKDAILPGVRGMRGPLSCLTAARLGIAWGAIGAATACFDSALAYAKERVQFGGKPIAGHQLVQAKLADVVTDLTAMQLMALEASRLKEEGRLRPQHVSLVKRHNAHAALTAARTCRDILGANGITLDYPVMRHMCNLETVVTYEGTHDIHTLVVGQDLTGLAAFE